MKFEPRMSSVLLPCKQSFIKVLLIGMHLFSDSYTLVVHSYNLYNKFLPQNLSVVKKFQDANQCTIRQSNGEQMMRNLVGGI